MVPLSNNTPSWPTDDRILQAQTKYGVPSSATIQSNNIVYMLGKHIVIPKEATDLIVTILIAGHFTLAGHRGLDSTLSIISRHFTWLSMKLDVQTFVSKCLHCLRTKGGRMIPRPFGSTYRSTRSNEHLHFDFLWMGPSYDGNEYILALKDDMSHYCRLVPCHSADSVTTAKVLFQWFADFGVPPLWTSDMGTHFVNHTIATLAESFKCTHNIVLSGCSWVNGSVERLLKDVLAVTRSLLSEIKLQRQDWPSLCPLIQHVLNHTPVQSLGGKAPVEVFTLLEAQSPFPVIYTPTGSVSQAPLSPTELISRTEALRSSLQTLHKDVSSIRSHRLKQNRKAQRGVVHPNFTIGDYVLLADVKQKITKDKLYCEWIGPYQITACPRPYVFTLTSLVNNTKRDAHISRIKFFDNASYAVSEELKEHIGAQGLKYEVESIISHRKGLQTYELLVHWRGFTDAERTWEPFKSVVEDVPAYVQTYINTLPSAEADLLNQFATQHSREGAL